MLYNLRCLKRSGATTTNLSDYYAYCIRSTLTYAYPSFCNLPDNLLNKLYQIERRANHIIGRRTEPALELYVNNLCVGLAKNICKNFDTHRLSSLFIRRPFTQYNVLRNPAIFIPPQAYTNRFKNSFIKYAYLCNL